MHQVPYSNDMSRRSTAFGIAIFAVAWCLCAWVTASQPLEFIDDASEYNALALNLLEHGAYSLDGKQPFFGREPGQSVFLAVVYAMFGTENWWGIFAMQGLLYLCAAHLFCREWSVLTNKRTAQITWFLLLTFPAVLHVVFAAIRESVTLSCCLLFLAFTLRLQRTQKWQYAVFAGTALGYLLLTYAPFMLLPIALVPVLWLCNVQWRSIGLLLGTCAVVVSPWLVRNYQHQGQLCFAGCNRSAVFWSVRGQQAEHLRGLEPLRCLWAEYISRDWSERSPYCSFNAVMHRTFPDGITGSEADKALGDIGKQKIMQHPVSYAWFSVFEILELHLPFVNGWGFLYNLLAAVSTCVVYIGCLLSLGTTWRRQYLLPLLCMAYITGIFILTDATPRYLVPVVGCYIAFSAIGYDRLLTRWHRR